MKEENGGELPERIVYVSPESLLSTECLLILTRVLLFVFGSPVRHGGIPLRFPPRQYFRWTGSLTLAFAAVSRRLQQAREGEQLCAERAMHKRN